MRILLVDDEAEVLEGYRLAFRSKRRVWHLDLAPSAELALERISGGETYDAVISEVRMKGMSGTELLERIRLNDPDTLRVVLTGLDDTDEAHRGVVSAHRWLMKPCPRETLFSALEGFERALARVGGAGRARDCVLAVTSLPSTGVSYQAVARAEATPEDSIGAVAKVIESDPSTTAKLLQVVNSAFFGIPQRLVAVRDAVAFLGSETVKSVALSEGLKCAAADTSPALRRFVDQLTRHSFTIGQVAAALLKESVPLGRDAHAEAFAGGVLHDIGWLALAVSHPAEVQAARAENSLAREAQVFGADHAGLGAALLDLWGLPGTLVEVVAQHHSELPPDVKDPPTAVTVAHHVVHALTDADARTELERAAPEQSVAWLEIAREYA